MSDQSYFPVHPQAKLSHNELINYLLQQQQRGYGVFQAEGRNSDYELVLDDVHTIRFIMTSHGQVQVQGYKLNNIVQYYDITKMHDLKQAVDRLAQKLIGARWQQSPTTARLSEDTPATNLVTISNLIGTSSIEAIFDPYLENRSLISLLDILSFGASWIANEVRVLSTSKKQLLLPVMSQGFQKLVSMHGLINSA